MLLKVLGLALAAVLSIKWFYQSVRGPAHRYISTALHWLRRHLYPVNMVTRAATNPEGVTGEFKGDIEVSSKLPSKGDLERVADLPVLDGSGEAHTFKSLHTGTGDRRRVLIIFIRHFFCGVRYDLSLLRASSTRRS